MAAPEELKRWQRLQVVNFLLRNGNKGRLVEIHEHFKRLGVKHTHDRYAARALNELRETGVLTRNEKGPFVLNLQAWTDHPESRLKVSDEIPLPSSQNTAQEKPARVRKSGAPGKKVYKTHSQEACNCLEAMQRELAKVAQKTDTMRKLLKKCDTVLQKARDLEQREIQAKH